MKIHIGTFFLWVAILLGTSANAQSDPIKMITRDDRFLEILERLEEGEFEDLRKGASISDAWSDGARGVLNLLKEEGFEILESNGVVGLPRDEAMLKSLTNLLQYFEETYYLALENLKNPPIPKRQEGEVFAYQRRYAELSEDGEVKVLVDDTPGPLVYSPDHSRANTKGMLRLGNVNVAKECTTLEEAFVMRQFVEALIETVRSS